MHNLKTHPVVSNLQVHHITMSHSPKLTYEPYNKKSLVVHGGDKLLHSKAFRQINGRWNSRLIQGTGPAWLIPRTYEKQLVDLLAKLNREEELNHMTTTAKSRKEQHKYHRAVSESEYSSDESQQSVPQSTDQITAEDKVQKYYRNFKKTPESFKTPEYVYEQQRYMSEETPPPSQHSSPHDSSKQPETDSDFSESDSGFPEPAHDYKNYKPSPSPDLHSSPEIHTYARKKVSSHKPAPVLPPEVYREYPHRSSRKERPRDEYTPERMDTERMYSHKHTQKRSSNTHTQQVVPSTDATHRGKMPVKKQRRRESDVMQPYQEPMRERKRHRNSLADAPSHRSDRRERRERYTTDTDVDAEELRYLHAKMAELESRMARMTSSRKHSRR